ncbi:MAG TPA: GTP-binding protein [bacterium]|nr:GTP-binding protein [bacterium]
MRSSASILKYPQRARKLRIVSVHGSPGAGKSEFLRSITARWNAGGAMTHLLTIPEARGKHVCYSCSLRNQLKKALVEAANCEVDTLFLETPCAWSPVEIAECLEDLMETDADSRVVPETQAVVSVVDARYFWEDLEAPETFFDSISAAEALMEEIEFTDLIVLTNVEEIDEKDLAEIEAYIRKLQTRVEILRRGRDDDLLLLLIGQKRYDYDETFRSATVDRSPTWLYSRKRPFHPARLSDYLQKMPEEVIRATGLIWIATKPEDAYRLNYIAPAFLMMSPDEPWLAGADPFDVAYAFQEDPKLREVWDAKWGDRRNEIAFVGDNLPVKELEAGLDRCLLSDIEMRQDWKRFEDPLSEWIDAPEPPDSPDHDPPEHDPPEHDEIQ